MTTEVTIDLKLKDSEVVEVLSKENSINIAGYDFSVVEINSKSSKKGTTINILAEEIVKKADLEVWIGGEKVKIAKEFEYDGADTKENISKEVELLLNELVSFLNMLIKYDYDLTVSKDEELVLDKGNFTVVLDLKDLCEKMTKL